MTPQALATLIANGEDTRHQFKRGFAHVDSLAAELVAFANGLGGTLLIGVEDDGSVSGLSLQEVNRLNQMLSNAASQHVNPAINPVSTNVRTEQGQLVMVVQVQSGLNKPYVALREALINAICHRDYGNTADIQIKIFENSLHIWSPGTLPFDVSVADLLDPVHASRPRNKLIAQVFFDLGLIERYGGGIQRILAACESAGLPPPELENFQGGFRMVFKQTAQVITPQVEQLLQVLTQDSGRQELMHLLGLKDREHFRASYLAPALQQGLIAMTIPHKPNSRLQQYRLTQAGQQWLATAHKLSANAP